MDLPEQYVRRESEMSNAMGKNEAVDIAVEPGKIAGKELLPIYGDAVRNGPCEILGISPRGLNPDHVTPGLLQAQGYRALSRPQIAIFPTIQ